MPVWRLSWCRCVDPDTTNRWTRTTTQENPTYPLKRDTSTRKKQKPPRSLRQTVPSEQQHPGPRLPAPDSGRCLSPHRQADWTNEYSPTSAQTTQQPATSLEESPHSNASPLATVSTRHRRETRPPFCITLQRSCRGVLQSRCLFNGTSETERREREKRHHAAIRSVTTRNLGHLYRYGALNILEPNEHTLDGTVRRGVDS